MGLATQGHVQRVIDGLLSPLRVREGVVQGMPSTQSILVEGIPYLIRGIRALWRRHTFFWLSVLGGVLAWRVWRGLLSDRWAVPTHPAPYLLSVQPSASCSPPSVASLSPGAVELMTLESEPSEM